MFDTIINGVIYIYKCNCMVTLHIIHVITVIIILTGFIIHENM